MSNATAAPIHPNQHTHTHFCANNKRQLTSHTHTHPYSLHNAPNPDHQRHQHAATPDAIDLMSEDEVKAELRAEEADL